MTVRTHFRIKARRLMRMLKPKRCKTNLKTIVTSALDCMLIFKSMVNHQVNSDGIAHSALD